MRLILLSVLLVACDQGAKPAAAVVPEPPPIVVQQAVHTVPIAPPPYRVKDTADFVAKTTMAIDEIIGIFEQGGKDCDVVASGLRRVGAVNRTRFDTLQRYSEAHPEAQAAVNEGMKERMSQLTSKLMPTMTACLSHRGLKAALEELSEMQHAQRPR